LSDLRLFFIFSVKEGLGTVLEQVGTDLDVKLNCIVKNIQYDARGVFF